MSKSFVLCFSIFSFCFAGLYCEQEWKSETREIAKEMSGLTKTKTDIRNGLKTSISRYILNNFEIDKKIALEQSFSKRVPMCLRFKSKAFLGLVKDSIPGWPVYISEEKTKQLYSMVKELSDEIGMPVPKIFFINNFFNAFATSLTQNFSLICLGGDLVKELNDDELRCIIAHELGHIKKYHVLKSLAFLKVTSKLFNSAFNRLMPHLCEVDYSKEKRNFVFRRDVSALEVKKINAKIKWIGKGYRLTHASLLCLYYRSN